jgi:hypothetical protein
MNGPNTGGTYRQHVSKPCRYFFENATAVNWLRSLSPMKSISNLNKILFPAEQVKRRWRNDGEIV